MLAIKLVSKTMLNIRDENRCYWNRNVPNTGTISTNRDSTLSSH